jgi:hypothetical protein
VTTAGLGPQSDHWPFAGAVREEARVLTERWLHPHTPDDEWSPDFRFSGLGRCAELALEIGRALAEESPETASDATSSR